MKILITGGAGFIGSNMVRYMVNKYPERTFVNLDKLTYAGNLDNLRDVEGKQNYSFVKGDVCNLDLVYQTMKDVDCVIHLAAESHVDNSIGNSLVFTMSNTYGTHVILEVARQFDHVQRILHVSTDEVYGDIVEGSFSESAKLSPNNPYSASKAAAEMIIQAYHKTYRMPIVMVRGNNVFGPHQYPEKIISRFVTNVLQGEKVPLHGSGTAVRSWIYVLDFCEALDTVFERGELGEVYNIGTHDELSNLQLTRLILKKLGKGEEFIQLVSDRPFNDRRYSLDLQKLQSLGWTQKYEFESALEETIEWYEDNVEWWTKLK